MAVRSARATARSEQVTRPAPQHEDEDVLMAEYVETQSPAIRDRVVVACTPLVRRIASEFVFSGVPSDDLVQVGYIGLLNAIAAFDPDRGAKFATYASYLIRGEIRHYLRDQRDTIRKPRWLQKLNSRIEDTVGKYVSESGRFPGLEELAEELNIEEGGLLEVLRTREMLRTISLETDEEGGDLRVDRDRIRHRSHISFQLPIEDRVMLVEAMESLSSLQRKVLYYLFYTDLTQTEAAKRIGISQKHVSRVLASALAKLRGVMGTPHTGTL
ncbi:MAG: sigma-70 family RNA polymerase sigma factor [bacterium]